MHRVELTPQDRLPPTAKTSPINRNTYWPNVGDRVQITDRQDQVLATSQNLRGILDYARLHGVCRVYVHQCDNPAKVLVLFIFANDARSMTTWASFSVACQWILDRRSWGLDLEHEYTSNMRLYA